MKKMIMVLALAGLLAMPCLALAQQEVEQAPSGQVVCMDEDELAALIERSVAKQVRPLRMSLMRMEQGGPGPTEIAGGIGYIVGLAGLVMFFKSRKREED